MGVFQGLERTVRRRDDAEEVGFAADLEVAFRATTVFFAGAAFFAGADFALEAFAADVFVLGRLAVDDFARAEAAVEALAFDVGFAAAVFAFEVVEVEGFLTAAGFVLTAVARPEAAAFVDGLD